ncbi:MAG: cobalamin-binding protein [Arenicellales bacterium]
MSEPRLPAAHTRPGRTPRGKSVLEAGALIASIIAVLAIGAPTAWSLTIKDDRGQTVELASPARRVVSLAPSITELVYAAGGGDRLIAASKYSDYPPAARRLPRIDDAFSVNLEELVALHPDLVIAWKSGNDPRIMKRLANVHVPVFVLEPREIGDIPRDLERIGRLLGTEEAARDRAARFTKAIEGIRERYAGRTTVRVFYQIARRPLMTLNGRQMFTAVLNLCGGSNVFKDLTPIAPTVDREEVLVRDPQVILISSTIPSSSDLIQYWSGYPNLTAARLHNIFLVDSDLINRQTPRLAEGARRLCMILDRARGKLAARSADHG